METNQTDQTDPCAEDFLGAEPTFTVIAVGASPFVTAHGCEWEVHAPGCRDIARTVNACAGRVETWEIAGADVDAAIAAEVAVYTDQDQGWTAEDHHVMGCARR